MVFVFAGMMENMFVFFHTETAKGVKPHTVGANGLMQMKENKQTQRVLNQHVSWFNTRSEPRKTQPTAGVKDSQP